MGLYSSVKKLFHPYYLCNVLLSVSFIACKMIEPLCHVIVSPAECGINFWESEILFFLIVIIAFRSRKSGARSIYAYISTASMYAKVGNILLWFSIDPIKGVIYIISIIVLFLVVGEPIYDGPENIIYFNASGLEEELSKSSNTYWLVVFYAVWNPVCNQLAPVFSKLSLEYSLPQFKFGKLDVGRYPELAKKYHINDTSFSLQLPTIVLYKGDKELMRRPCLDSNGKFQKFFFTEDNIRAAYDMNNIYLDCKKSLKSTAIDQHKKDN